MRLYVYRAQSRVSGTETKITHAADKIIQKYIVIMKLEVKTLRLSYFSNFSVNRPLTLVSEQSLSWITTNHNSDSCLKHHSQNLQKPKTTSGYSKHLN